MDEKEIRTEEKEKSALSVKARRVSAVFIFLMGIFLIYSHGFVAGLLFIIASAIAYEPNNSGKENFIASMSGVKRFAVVFLLLFAAIFFLPNNNSNNPAAMASTAPVITQTPIVTPVLIETPTPIETPAPDVTSTPATTSDESSTSNVTNYQDNQWSATCMGDLSIVDDDMKACSYASTNDDVTSLSYSVNSLYNDSNVAMNDSNLYSVSPELQGVKDEYILTMVQANLVATLLIMGVNEFNNGNATAMKQNMELADQSTKSYTQHLDEVIKKFNIYNEKQNNQPGGT